jgi:hypothetical protein
MEFIGTITAFGEAALLFSVMIAQNTNPRRRSPWRLLLGILCITLVVVGGFVSVTHSHPDGVPGSDCGLCSTAHLAVKAGQSITQIPVKLLFIRVNAAVVLTRPRALLSDFALFTRPPPADSSLA